MNEMFAKKLQQVELGKKIFKTKFNIDELTVDDTFLLILTDSEDCLYYGKKYLPDFIREHCRRNIYILLRDIKYQGYFQSVSGNVIVCENKELYSLAMYLNVFHDKEFFDPRIIFLTEKDEYNGFAEEVMKEKSVSMEEYVAISLYQLRNVEKVV